MNETLLDESPLVSTIRTMSCSGIDERVMRANKVGADEPFFGVLGNLAEEKENGEAHAEFILLKLDTGGPIPKAQVRWDVMMGLDYWVATVVMSARCQKRLCVGSGSYMGRGCFFRFYRNFCGGSTRSEKRGHGGRRGRERTKDRKSVEPIHDVSNRHFDSLWVAQVKSVKLGVAISEFGCVRSSGRSPERSISVPEWRQGCKKYTEIGIYVNLAHKICTCIFIDRHFWRKGEAAVLRVTVGDPDPRVQGRPQ